MSQRDASGMVGKQSPRAITRRGFLNAMLSLPVMAASLALTPKGAEARTYTLKHLRVTLPPSWKKLVVVTVVPSCIGVNTRIDCYKYYYGDKGSDEPRDVNVLTLSEPSTWQAGIAGRPRVSFKGARSHGKSLAWKLALGGNTVWAEASNVPYEVWLKSRKKKGADRLSEREAKELLRISTGGSIEYASLMSWPKSKAKRRGAKAVRRWVGEKVVKRIKIVRGPQPAPSPMLEQVDQPSCGE